MAAAGSPGGLDTSHSPADFAVGSLEGTPVASAAWVASVGIASDCSCSSDPWSGNSASDYSASRKNKFKQRLKL